MKLKKWYMLFIVYFLGGGKGVLGGGGGLCLESYTYML